LKKKKLKFLVDCVGPKFGFREEILEKGDREGGLLLPT
jgi:hypothetical protein